MELLLNIAKFATLCGMIFCICRVVKIVDEANEWW